MLKLRKLRVARPLLLLNPALPVPIQMEQLKKASTSGFRLRDIQTISTTAGTTMPVIGTVDHISPTQRELIFSTSMRQENIGILIAGINPPKLTREVTTGTTVGIGSLKRATNIDGT